MAGTYEDDEWEDGPLEDEAREETAPVDPEDVGEELQAQLEKFDAEQDFEFAGEPEVADPGIPPTAEMFSDNAPAIPEGGALDEQLQTLEGTEPFDFQQASAEAPEAPNVSAPDANLMDEPDDEIGFPPESFGKFLEQGGETDGRTGSLPGMPRASQDGPIDPLKQHLDSSFSLARAQNDFLIDHSQQLDGLLEGLERGRL